MSTIIDLVDEVNGFMGGTQERFLTENGKNLTLAAINNAKKKLQRMRNWSFGKASVALPNVDILNGALLNPTATQSTAGCQWGNTSNPGGFAAGTQLNATVNFTVYNIRKAYLPLLGLNLPYFPISTISREAQIARLQRQTEGIIATMQQTTLQFGYAERYYYLVRDNNLVYIWPANINQLGQTFTLGMDVYLWFPDYDFVLWTGDWFLQYAQDILKWMSIVEINQFLKEDQRFPVSTKMLNDAIQDLIMWDTNNDDNADEQNSTLD